MTCPSCNHCNACGRFTPKKKRMVKPKCMDCGGEIDLSTGKCTVCNKQCMPPLVAAN